MTRPEIRTEVLAELDRRGVDSVRALLIRMANGQAGPGRGASINLGGGIEVSRGDMEAWLRGKAAVDARWIKIGAIAAIAAASLAALAWLSPIR